MLIILLYLSVGVMAGLLSGLLGIGGGIVVVPTLAFIFSHAQLVPAHVVMHSAIASSLAVMVFTAQASVWGHWRYGRIVWPIFWQLMPGIILGTAGGVIFADVLPTDALRMVFAVFLLLVSVRMFFLSTASAGRPMPPLWGLVLMGLVVGFVSGLLGIGGGVMMVPLLVWCSAAMHSAIAISASSGLVIALTGTLVAIGTGYNEPMMPNWTSGYVYWPAVVCITITSVLVAPLGAKLAYRVSVEKLKKVFAVILFISGINMLL